PLHADIQHDAAAGHPLIPKLTVPEEEPARTVTVLVATPPGSTRASLGTVETTIPCDGVFLNVKESTTPATFSTNSYLIAVGETWNHPNPWVRVAARQRAIHASVRQVAVPLCPPVPRTNHMGAPGVSYALPVWITFSKLTGCVRPYVWSFPMRTRSTPRLV